MTLAYFDCFNGASGDMIVGALLAAGADFARLEADLAPLGIPDLRLDAREVRRHGLVGTKFGVSVHGTTEGPAEHLHTRHVHAQSHRPGHAHGPPHAEGHHDDTAHSADHERAHHDDAAHPAAHEHAHDPAHGHRTLADVAARLTPLPAAVRTRAMAVFARLAEAEARVHGSTRDAVHFHEVGQDDAIVDVVATLLALDQLGVTEVWCSPLPLGSGLVRCAHGVMPVPVPAVAALVTGVPTYDNGEPGELVTPTGAALLTTLATRFGPAPRWTPRAVGYGAGSREGTQVPNLVRVTLGDPVAGADAPVEEVVELAANLDDLNPQFYAPLLDKLLAAGALDVTQTPTLMKKGRPGIVLGVLCPVDRLDACAALIFAETTTLGLRYAPVQRRVLARRLTPVETPWGAVQVKVGLLAGRPVNLAPEHEDCRRVAEAAGVPIKDVWQEAIAAARRAGLAGPPSGP